MYNSRLIYTIQIYFPLGMHAFNILLSSDFSKEPEIFTYFPSCLCKILTSSNFHSHFLIVHHHRILMTEHSRTAISMSIPPPPPKKI